MTVAGTVVICRTSSGSPSPALRAPVTSLPRKTFLGRHWYYDSWRGSGGDGSPPVAIFSSTSACSQLSPAVPYQPGSVCADAFHTFCATTTCWDRVLRGMDSWLHYSRSGNTLYRRLQVPIVTTLNFLHTASTRYCVPVGYKCEFRAYISGFSKGRQLELRFYAQFNGFRFYPWTGPVLRLKWTQSLCIMDRKKPYLSDSDRPQGSSRPSRRRNYFLNAPVGRLLATALLASDLPFSRKIGRRGLGRSDCDRGYN